MKIFGKPELSILPGNIAFNIVLAFFPFLILIILIVSSFSIDVNSVIVLKDANDAKVYIFNFDTNQQTQDFYDLLCQKVDKVGASYTENHH